MDSSAGQRFSSRTGLILSALGIAIGTGNIWRFPRIVAQNGSDQGAGAFLVAWVIFLFLWSVPLIIAEYAMGRKARMGVVGTFAAFAGRRLAWMGSFVAFVAEAITIFYSIVVGWCIYYFVYVLTHSLPDTADVAMSVWETYQSSVWPLVTHALVMLLGGIAIWRGIGSIERINKILVPALLIIIILALVRALTLPGAGEGIAYLFTFDWQQLSHPKIWMEALTQNAWDTGAGWGLFLTYGAYMKHKHGITKNAVITAVGNNTVSMMAALMIFGTIFAVLRTEMGLATEEVLAIMRTSGPASTGLTFIWMPQLFARMFLGAPVANMFFLGLSFAGFSSLIAQLELPTRVLIDSGLKRPTAILMVIGISYLLGIPSAINLGFLANQDFVWGLALMISGAFVTFAVLRYGITRLREEELTVVSDQDWILGSWWDKILGAFVPVAAGTLLLWWLYLSATIYSPDDWYNPFRPFSVMTCFVQWGIALAIFVAYNNRTVNSLSSVPEIER